MRRRILFICGSMNQTTQMHQIANQLPEFDKWFTPYYGDGYINALAKAGLAEFAIVGRKHVARCLTYLRTHHLAVDWRGRSNSYDLVVTCSDILLPKNIQNSKIVLVQEGMTDPENFAFRLVKRFPSLPRWIASTSTTGMSGGYDRFCVASEGYRELFIRKGADPDKTVVTGIPNFDNCKRFFNNSFPYKGFVLVCTSDARETLKWENRKRLIQKALKIADGRLLIFKLHPNERKKTRRREIERYAPEALVYTEGSAEEMIANCDVLITTYSSTVYVGLALQKEVHSAFDVTELRRLTPLQHGSAARNIADVCREILRTHEKIQFEVSELAI
ncbi:MAG: hypothetical protein C5B54_06615 [Acidobacteria bacterium]|nr:MAG: hypothetical protein C5B54_06615 [Acidobacteriota bacterium]